MIKFAFKLLVILLFISACEKSEELEVKMKGTLKGTIETRDEMLRINNNHEDVLIQLEGSEPLITTKTDSSGDFEILDLPMGTYNIILTKDGYGEYQHQGFQFIGGDVPYIWNQSLTKIPDLQVENLVLQISNGDLVVTFKIANNYSEEELQIFDPTVVLYMHTENNPSTLNYLDAYSARVTSETDEFEIIISALDEELFESGDTVYMIAYASFGGGAGYYDIQMNKYIRTGYGEPSRIASIILP